MFVLLVTEELEEWEDSKSIGRKRQWFSIDDALSKLALHKPAQRCYLQQLKKSGEPSNSIIKCECDEIDNNKDRDGEQERS